MGIEIMLETISFMLIIFFFICLLFFHTDIMQSLSFKTKQTGLICFPNMQGENAHNNATISEDLHSITPKSNISERYHLKVQRFQSFGYSGNFARLK